jgi:hypothetical protein
MRALLLAFVTLIFLVGAVLGTPPPLASASRVEAFRLAPSFDEHYRTSKRFHGAKLVSGPHSVRAPEAALAARELERIYSVDWPSFYCVFAPRYGLRFHIATSTVDVLICPHCGEVHFLSDGVLRRAYMQDGAPDLMRMLKPLFPRYPLRENEA